jgi:proteasome lid subunit RPN8/RPN11
VDAAVRIRREVLAGLRERAQREPARECCGLLAGRDAITHIFPATNAASEPATAYEIAPKELFRLVREIRAGGLELMGIYHSHPNGKNEPSARDIEQAYYPDVAYFILSPRADEDKSARAFSIQDGMSVELEICTL